MAKRYKIDDKYYRYRRGKLVEIPIQWLNKVPTKGTLRNRKHYRKLKKKQKTRQDLYGELLDKDYEEEMYTEEERR